MSKYNIKDSKIINKIEDAVLYEGSGFGPSLIGLYLFGPFGIEISEDQKLVKFNLDKDLKESLIDRSCVIKDAYKKSILPKVHSLVQILTDNKANFPVGRKKFESSFNVLSFERVRSILRSSWKYQFGLDDETVTSLGSKEKMVYKNSHVHYFYDKGNSFLFKYRFKKGLSARKKYEINHDKLTDKQKDRFGEFIAAISKDSRDFWERENYLRYKEKFGKGLVEMVLGDFCGMTVIDLIQERSEERMQKLVDYGIGFNYKGFTNFHEEFDDHRGRSLDKRPGGIHFTFLDKGLVNFPIEFKYLGIKSGINEMFGPHANQIYATRGKKANNNGASKKKNKN